MDPNQPKSGNPQAPTDSLPWITTPPQPNTPPPTPAISFTPPAAPTAQPPVHSYPTPTVIGDSNNYQPPPPVSNNIESPVTIIPAPNNKFPLMIVTTLIILTITGFSGSYFYFRSYGKTNKNQIVAPLITPPVTVEPSPSSEEINPFDPATAGENPFSNE